MRIIDISALKNPINQTNFEKAVKNFIEMHFPDYWNFSLMEERRKYKASELKEIWEQNKELAPYICELYYKGEFVKDIYSTEKPQDVLLFIKRRVKEINEQKEKQENDIAK